MLTDIEVALMGVLANVGPALHASSQFQGPVGDVVHAHEMTALSVGPASVVAAKTCLPAPQQAGGIDYW